MKEKTSDKSKTNILKFPESETHYSAISDKSEHKRHSGKKTGFILFCGAALAVFFITIFMVFGDTSFNRTDVVNTEPINVLSTESYDFAAYKSGYVFAKDGRISCFNSNQELQWEITGSKTAPTVVTNGRYALTYYTEDKLAVVTNGVKTRKINTDGNVLYGSVNSNGFCALIVEEDGFKNQIAVYDSDGKSLFKWHNSDRYITSVQLSDNNNSLAASELKLSDDGVFSNILLIDIRRDLDIEEISLGDCAVCGVQFISKNSFVAVTDGVTACYTTSKKEKWKIDYSGKVLFTYDMGSDGIALVFGEDDSALSSSQIEYYNLKGKKTGSFKSGERVESIEIADNVSLLSYGRKISVVNCKGKELSAKVLNYDIKESIFIGNKKCALVISGSSASLIKPE